MSRRHSTCPPTSRCWTAPRRKSISSRCICPRPSIGKSAAETLGKIDLTVKVAAAGTETVSARTSLDLTKAPDVPKASYVPEPQPVRSKYEIGAFYFPGFPTMSQWQPILRLSQPQTDSRLVRRVEPGVRRLADQVGRRTRHQFLHGGLVLVPGQSPAGALAPQRLRQGAVQEVPEMGRHVGEPQSAEHAFRGGLAQGHAVLDRQLLPHAGVLSHRQPARRVHLVPDNVRHDLGGSSEAAKLYAMSQEMAKAAGYPGIYFVAMSGHDSPERTKELVSEGYEAATTYHSFQLTWQRAQSDRFPYAGLLDTCPELWREAEKSAQGLLYLPIVDTGWDARPWHGEKTMVAYGRTPELLGKLCQLGRQYADETGKKIILLGPVNEWGEGSYIEPYAEYGFQDLDQVRAAFCEPGDWPPNLIPADVGLGPYDLPPVAAKTAWEFDAGEWPGRLDGQWRCRGVGGEGRPAGRPLDRPRSDIAGPRHSGRSEPPASPVVPHAQRPQSARAGLLGHDAHGDERRRITGHRSGRRRPVPRV